VVNSDGEGFQNRLDDALTLPESAQRFLYVYWLLGTEWLKRREEESAVPHIPSRSIGSLPELVHEAEKQVANFKEVTERLRRVELYLGHVRSKNNPKTLDGAKWLVAARWIRAAAQAGYSDEENAEWLGNFFASRSEETRGRKAGTVDSSGHALLALVLYELAPKVWSFPRLADHFCKTSQHKPHTADSDCVDKLKKAVKRLRDFLQELGYKQPGK